MIKVFILSDSKEIENEIRYTLEKLDKPIVIVDSNNNVSQSMIQLSKIKIDYLIIYLKRYNVSHKYFERFNTICIRDNNNQEIPIKCKIIQKRYFKFDLRNCINDNKEEVIIEKPIIKRSKVKVNFVVIGISTGGPYALKELIPKIKKNISVPIVIVQHMPSGFTKDLAKSLNYQSNLTVEEAKDEFVKNGQCYVLQGGVNTGIENTKTGLKFKTYPKKYGFYTPSFDYFLRTIESIPKINPLIVVMTGMGNDGLEGIKKLKDDGRGTVITQIEKSCVVYGMPKVIDQAGFSDIKSQEIFQIAQELNKRV